MGTDAALRDLLANADLELEGRLLEASNAAFLGSVEGVRCVYKPVRGERELWDFPSDSLSRREVAAYELAIALGIASVPVTVWRENGPAGPGMCQRWIDHTELLPPIDVAPAGTSPAQWLVVMQGQAPDGSTVELAHADVPALRDAAFFDVVCNNADRKGGHLLVDHEERIWLIDHGVTLHHEPKLRTVLWGFAGQPLEPRHLEALKRLDVNAVLGGFVNDAELAATRDRVQSLLNEPRFPFPSGDWPALPWPLF